VNYVDLWGLNASDKPRGLEDFLGKIIAAPMTAFGFAVGTALLGISIITGNGGYYSFENNAITITTGLNLKGSITFGNTIIHAGGKAIGKGAWNSGSSTDRYDGKSQVNLGEHEEAHTYQYQKYGLLTIPAIINSAIKNGGIGAGSWHGFIGKSSFEKAADDYAESGGNPLP
jgi:hypothetical protein